MNTSIHIFDPEQDRPDNGPMATFAREVVAWFLEDYTSTNEGALAEVRRILGLFVLDYGDTPVTSLIGDDLRQFVKRQPRVKKANSISRWYRTIKHCFNQAERLGKITKSPFKGVQLPRGDRGRDLTPREFQTVLRRATPAFRRVLIFCRYCGARPVELREAIWDFVNWSPECPTVVFKKHKTIKTRRDPKPRKLYLPVPLLKLLLWLKARSHSDFVFTNSFGGQWTCDSLCKNLKRIRKKAKLPDDVKLYGCRHMFATQAILNGTELAELQELMGHSSSNTTQIYVHLAGKDDFMRSVIEKAVGRKPKHE